jgi:Glycosyltransferase family 87
MSRLDQPDPHLLTPRSLLFGLLAVPVALIMEGLSIAIHGTRGLFNDFYLYWASVKLLAAGQSPYDLGAVQETLQHAGLHPTLSLGYTYPVLLAYVMLPLSRLPPQTAAVLFSALSLAGLALAVALLLAPLSRLAWWEPLLLAMAAGSFTSVTGSLHFGQVNLVLLPIFALAMRGAARALALAAVSAVKLYPVVAFLAFLPRGSRERLRLWLGLAAFAILAIGPNLAARTGAGHLVQMFTPDAYWSNESINGFISRLGGGPYASGPGLLPGLPVAWTMLAVAAALGALTFAVVVAVRGRPWDGCLALLLTYGVIAAPRNSLWNFAPLVMTMVWCWLRARRRPVPLATLVVGWMLINLQAWIYTFGAHFYRGSAALGLLASLGLYGALMLWGLGAFLLLERTRSAPAPAE